ncbi:MAG: hypothetical protein KKE77_13020 [Alphaproteobacteria bacterium]|nr:hypothetical protein [Alphaproteobacteria bacterium]
MCSPISSAVLFALALAACSEVQEQAAEGAARIDCAVGPGAELGADCMVERTGDVLVIRHPDGSFRRLNAAGLGTADGSDPGQIVEDGETVEIRVAGDRYRWPQGAFDDGE